MTNTSSKAGNSRQKPSFIRRLTRSLRKAPHVKLADKKGKATMVEAEPKKQVAKPEDDMWIQTTYIDLTSSDSDSSMESDPSEEIPAKGSEEPIETDPSEEKTTEEQKSPENEPTSKYTPVKYPIFPEEDSPEPMIILKGDDTYLPGSPDILPERIPYRNWLRDLRNQGRDVTPCLRMIEYSEKSAKYRIPITDTMEKRKPWYDWGLDESIDWYNNFCDTHTR